jgi:hypothetical protein
MVVFLLIYSETPLLRPPLGLDKSGLNSGGGLNSGVENSAQLKTDINIVVLLLG